MSLRDYFAGQVIASLYQNNNIVELALDIYISEGYKTAREAMTVKAYQIADAMLAARKEKP
tara:strand:- start:104 stop:286 length:183 start_codon:yes stop_codon:yes gene_type:complete